MKIDVAKTALFEGLQTVQNVVSPRTTLPILSNVLFQGEKGKLLLTTTDLDVAICCTIEAKIVKSGATTLPARRLAAIVRELPVDDVEIEVDDKDVAAVRCGSTLFRIPGLSEEEFPTMARPEGKFRYTIDQGIFRDMLRKTAYAASTDETRFVLNGVFMAFKEGKLAMVATDGRRLALVEREVAFPEDAEVSMILPSKVANELIHTLADGGDMHLHTHDGRVMFAFGDILISSKLIDGTYPNWRQVIPSQSEVRVAIERELLLTALRRVSLVTADKMIPTRLTFADNSLTLAIVTPDAGEARETIPVKYDGPELTAAFNAEFMIDPLKNLAYDEIYLELTDDLSPGVIKCDSPFLYVLMPMRLNA